MREYELAGESEVESPSSGKAFILPKSSNVGQINRRRNECKEGSVRS